MQVNDTVTFHPGADPSIPHDDAGVKATVTTVNTDGTVDIHNFESDSVEFFRSHVALIAAGAENIEAHVEATVAAVVEDVVAEAKTVAADLVAAAENPPSWFAEELHKVEGFFGKRTLAESMEPPGAIDGANPESPATTDASPTPADASPVDAKPVA